MCRVGVYVGKLFYECGFGVFFKFRGVILVLGGLLYFVLVFS